MFISRKKPVQNLIIVPISLDLPQHEVKSASEQGIIKSHALQFKKQATVFVENFQKALAQEGDSAVELHISTRKSAIRLLVLEKKSANSDPGARSSGGSKESVSTRYKMRLTLQNLIYDKDSDQAMEWKMLSVTLKDGSVLVLRSRRCSNEDCVKQNLGTSGSIAPTNASDDEDLSTIIANGLDERETQDELYLELEERDLAIKNLNLRLKEVQSSTQHALKERDEMISQLQEKILSLQQEGELIREKERRTREIASEKEREYETLLRRAQHMEARLKEIQHVTPESTSSSPKNLKGSNDPLWVQRSLQLYNHVSLLEQEIFSLKKLFDYDRLQHEEKENDLIKKLRYYQQRDERVQREKQKLMEFVSRGTSQAVGQEEDNSGAAPSKRSTALTPDHYSIAQIQSLPESLKALESPLERLELLLSTLSDYLADRIETEPHDRLLSDVFNPVIKTLVLALVQVLGGILSSGLTGPWRLTRRNTVWDLITQHHMNLFTRNNRQHQALTEEELNMYYCVRGIRKNLDEKLSGSDWEPRFHSWVCVALNKQSLGAWISLMLKDEELVQSYYDKTKSVLFQEKDRVEMLLRELQSVPFALNEY